MPKSAWSDYRRVPLRKVVAIVAAAGMCLFFIARVTAWVFFQVTSLPHGTSTPPSAPVSTLQTLKGTASLQSGSEDPSWLALDGDKYPANVQTFLETAHRRTSEYLDNLRAHIGEAPFQVRTLLL